MNSPQEIFLLIGVPGSGKSWVSERARVNYECVQHDAFIGGGYLTAVMNAADISTKPVLAETPFSMSQIMEPLADRGYVVKPIFVIEKEDVLEDRWNARGTPPNSRKGHLTRQNTYLARVGEYHAFAGNSMDVLDHLNLLASERQTP